MSEKLSSVQTSHVIIYSKYSLRGDQNGFAEIYTYQRVDEINNSVVIHLPATNNKEF